MILSEEETGREFEERLLILYTAYSSELPTQTAGQLQSPLSKYKSMFLYLAPAELHLEDFC
jgi:hypothetical protein